MLKQIVKKQLFVCFFVLLVLVGCGAEEEISDFCTPLASQEHVAFAFFSGMEDKGVSLGKGRMGDIYSALIHAEIYPAEDDIEWDSMLWRLTLKGEKECLELGWTPAVPNAVYGQWIEGGSYTQPVWIVGATLPGRMMTYVPGCDPARIMSDQWQGEGPSVSDGMRLDLTLHCLLGAEAAEVSIPSEGQTVRLSGSAFSYEYTFFEADGSLYYQTDDQKVYLVPSEIIDECESVLLPGEHEIPITVSSGDEAITVPLADVDGAMYGSRLLPTLFTSYDEYGMPFSVAYADGTPCRWFRARIMQASDEERFIEGISQRSSNEYLGNSARSLKPGHTYLVMLTVSSDAKQLSDRIGDTYWFKIIPEE